MITFKYFLSEFFTGRSGGNRPDKPFSKGDKIVYISSGGFSHPKYTYGYVVTSSPRGCKISLTPEGKEKSRFVFDRNSGEMLKYSTFYDKGDDKVKAEMKGERYDYIVHDTKTEAEYRLMATIAHMGYLKEYRSELIKTIKNNGISKDSIPGAIPMRVEYLQDSLKRVDKMISSPQPAKRNYWL